MERRQSDLGPCPDIRPCIQQDGYALKGVANRVVQRRPAVPVPRLEISPGVEAGLHVPGSGGLGKDDCVPVRAIGCGVGNPRHKQGQDRGRAASLRAPFDMGFAETVSTFRQEQSMQVPAALCL